MELGSMGTLGHLREEKPQQKTEPFSESTGWTWSQSLHAVEQFDYRNLIKRPYVPCGTR